MKDATAVMEEAPPEEKESAPEIVEDVASEKDETPEVKMEDTPQFQLAVARGIDKRIQSEVDKRMTPVYEERDNAKRDVSKLKSALNIVETAEIEEWGDTPPIRDLQKERRRIFQARQEADDIVSDCKKRQDKLDIRENGIRAWELGIKYALADSTIHSQVEAFVDDLSVFKEDEGMEKYAQARAKEFQNLEPKNKKPTPSRPDSSQVGTSTSRSFTREQIRKMSPADYVKNRNAILEAQEAGRIKE